MRMRIESNRVTLLQLEESRPPPPSLFLSFNLLTAQLSIVSLSAEAKRGEEEIYLLLLGHRCGNLDNREGGIE